MCSSTGSARGKGSRRDNHIKRPGGAGAPTGAGKGQYAMSTLPPAEPEVKAEETDLVRALKSAQQTVEEHFPCLWPAVAAGLATCATLLLTDNTNPTALIYLGGAGSSKTTVAQLFADHPECYLSDNFTPASFVS